MRFVSALLASGLVSLALGTAIAAESNIYDLSPEQPNRIHVTADPALAAKLPADFKRAALAEIPEFAGECAKRRTHSVTSKAMCAPSLFAPNSTQSRSRK